LLTFNPSFHPQNGPLHHAALLVAAFSQLVSWCDSEHTEVSREHCQW
jgi:hypothetical protein